MMEKRYWLAWGEGMICIIGSNSQDEAEQYAFGDDPIFGSCLEGPYTAREAYHITAETERSE